MKEQLQNMHVIDVHAHPYVANTKPFTADEFVRKLSLSVIPEMFQKQQEQQLVFPGSNMYMQITLQRLAHYFSCRPNIEEVVEIRNERTGDFSKYTQELFQDANLRGLVLDFGYPTPRIPKETYDNLSGIASWEVYRIEPVMVRISKETTDFFAFIEQYRADLQQALQQRHILGLKTIIAYRSGLEIALEDERTAAAQYPEFRENERASVKALRDYCLHIAMEMCTEANKFMHIHTGIGDGEVVLPKASPSFLLDMLRNKKYRDTKVHLVHGGYPWMEEAAFIVSILPNVYMDISLQTPFAGHGVERIISQVFEMAPFHKVMYGSDAFTIPEMNWLGVHLFKECLERVLMDWIRKNYMNEEVALHIAELVLHKNFENAYREHLYEARQ
ncbi:amidohydrolase family protein [Aneurinibacillus aneurinilyticus]|uniref:amidohydrolase family protein n=1 Tax=Aneurinibacillus aneurinilyticus TaxID=1391 RepID=UPI0036719EA7